MTLNELYSEIDKLQDQLAYLTAKQPETAEEFNQIRTEYEHLLMKYNSYSLMVQSEVLKKSLSSLQQSQE